MDATSAALIGVVGMLVCGSLVWLRSEIIPRLDRMEGLLRSQGERTAHPEAREDAAAGG
ncbi:MAG: hypothetical protein J4F99_01740 [Acidimicrobiia bacterium]|nr:hypothetical protein [Acidimicrobiia bacterium]